MKVKDLKRKLESMPESVDDFEVYIDAGDINMLNLEKIYIGGAWNIVLSTDDEDADVEDVGYYDKTEGL